MFDSGERTREFYRKQGDERTKKQILQILDDRICEDRKEFGITCGHMACYVLEEIVWDLEKGTDIYARKHRTATKQTN